MLHLLQPPCPTRRSSDLDTSAPCGRVRRSLCCRLAVTSRRGRLRRASAATDRVRPNLPRSVAVTVTLRSKPCLVEVIRYSSTGYPAMSTSMVPGGTRSHARTSSAGTPARPWVLGAAFAARRPALNTTLHAPPRQPPPPH